MKPPLTNSAAPPAGEIHRFTDGKPWIVTQADCLCKWGGRDGGFLCRLCGFVFNPGDVARWQYLNDFPGGTGNVLVCEKCDGTKEEIHTKALAICQSISEFRKMGWIE